MRNARRHVCTEGLKVMAVDTDAPVHKLYADLRDNLRRIEADMGKSGDIVLREVSIGTAGRYSMALVYTDGLADKTLINDHILEGLMNEPALVEEAVQSAPSSGSLIQALSRHALAVDSIDPVGDFETLYDRLLSGDAIILMDGQAEGLAAGTRAWKERGVTEPSVESVIRGPREAFSETLRTNTSLIRRRIKDRNLWIETRRIGRLTKTDVAVVYMKNIASEEIVKEVFSRLDRIDLDGILESGYIEEMIQDEGLTPFPTVYNTERPDVVAAELLEGKVAILMDGTPIALVVPALFVSFIHASEDYYHRADVSTLVRILRYVGILIAMFLPSLYIAITTFHQEMIPTTLLISLAQQREGTPFPAFIEAVTMEVAFEILREAGLRMPRTIGPAVSIVGTLVIGQAAVEAGIVSAAMVIVVSTTAIASFVFPSYSLANAFRMLRFLLMGLAASFGLVGITAGVFFLIMHLCSLRSFGVPYMSPFAPLKPADQKDAVVRLPIWKRFARPSLIVRQNRRRLRQMPRKR